MTKEEARSLIGRTVLYTSGYGGEPEKVVITDVGVCLVGISWPDSGQRHFAVAGELMLLPEEGGDPLMAVQACLNNLAAAPIRTTLDSKQAEAALGALRELNWAAGLDFEGVPPAPSGASREYHAGRAVYHAWSLEVARTFKKNEAAREADLLARIGPEEAAAMLRRSRGSTPALVYLVTHTALGATKIGVSDAEGSRIAQHRCAGWQLSAAFQVTAKAALAIETEILRWWRRELRLPSFLGRHQMPQGGYTETVALADIDLAATVTRICNLAVQQDAALPSLSQSGRPQACRGQAS